MRDRFILNNVRMGQAIKQPRLRGLGQEAEVRSLESDWIALLIALAVFVRVRMDRPEHVLEYG